MVLDEGESGVVDGLAVVPQVGASGDPSGDGCGEVADFVARQRLAELGVELVCVGFDGVAEAGGVSPVVADFSVGPVAGCFEEGAVAAEADGIAALS